MENQNVYDIFCANFSFLQYTEHELRELKSSKM